MAIHCCNCDNGRHFAIAKPLIDLRRKRVNPNATRANEQMLLIDAARRGSLDIVKLLWYLGPKHMNVSTLISKAAHVVLGCVQFGLNYYTLY